MIRLKKIKKTNTENTLEFSSDKTRRNGSTPNILHRVKPIAVCVVANCETSSLL